MVPELGTIVGGKYRILRVLGEGGMGAVYEAENVLSLKRAAIKWLHPQLLPHEESYLRVLHEARAAARIRHRNVVDVYDVMREGDSIFLVMELLLGEPLSVRIARGGLTVHGYIALLLPALHGMAAAHAVGVVHRDIKPENIFLVTENGQREPVPKVIDFGISKVLDPDGGAHLTRSGITMGTPKYVSYEQLAGAKDVDARADVYAVGVMLYEALTGRPPYDATSFGQQAIRFATTVPRATREIRPDVPEILDAVVMRAIARDRDERFADLGSLIASLEPFSTPALFAPPLPAFPERSAETITQAAGYGVTTTPLHSTPPPSGVARLPSPSPLPDAATTHRERSRLFVRGAAAMLPVVVLGLAFSLWSREQREPAPAASTVQEHASQAVLPMPVQAERPGEARPSSAEPGALVRPQPALAAEPSAPDAGTPVVREKRSKRAASRAKRSVSPSPTLDVQSEPRTESAPSQNDRQLHRAGRVTRDQF